MAPMRNTNPKHAEFLEQRFFALRDVPPPPMWRKPVEPVVVAEIRGGSTHAIGSVRRLRRTPRKWLFGRYRPRTWQLLDATDAVVLSITRPYTLYKSTVTVHGPGGAPIGEIMQHTTGGEVRFGLVADGSDHGQLIVGFRDVAVVSDGQELARISEKSVNYEARINGPLDDPQRALVVAATVFFGVVFRVDAAAGGLLARMPLP